MPLGMFIDLFAVVSKFHRTTFVWSFKHVQEPLCQHVMGGGWNSKINIGANVLRGGLHFEP